MPRLPVSKPQELAEVVRAARAEAGVSQAELAERLGFSRDYMVDLESGRPPLWASRMFRVMNELGIRLSLEYGDHDADA